MKKKFFALPYIAWMIIFTVVPLILVFIYAFVDMTDMGNIVFTFDFIKTAFSGDNIVVLLRSLEYALITTIICLLISYPAAMFLSQLKSNIGAIVCLLFILPMWMNFLLRTYAWRALLDNNGLINNFLSLLGIPKQQLMYTEGAVIFGLVYDFLPFMLLPLYTAFQKLNYSYVEAAEDLGASRAQVLRRVILPLTRPAMITGITMVFMPAVSTFVISELLGGGKYMMYGELIQNEFLTMNRWNVGSALAVVMMILLVISMAITRKYDKDGVSLC